MPVLLLPLLALLVGFLVYRKRAASKPATAMADAGPATLPPPRKFVL